jgi:hypothetical protein
MFFIFISLKHMTSNLTINLNLYWYDSPRLQTGREFLKSRRQDRLDEAEAAEAAEIATASTRDKK